MRRLLNFLRYPISISRDARRDVRLRADPTIVRMAAISLQRSGERINYRQACHFALWAVRRRAAIDESQTWKRRFPYEEYNRPGPRGEAALDGGRWRNGLRPNYATAPSVRPPGFVVGISAIAVSIFLN